MTHNRIAIEETEAGRWRVVGPGLEPIECATNAEAWRVADRLAGEAVNRNDDVADWIFTKETNGF